EAGVGCGGGGGVADHGLYGGRKSSRWRDTMFRVKGGAVTDLQSTFVENWLESSGAILPETACFPARAPEGDTRVMIVDSSPSIGQSTRARILFQTLLASARKTICINTPYFLPDRS